MTDTPRPQSRHPYADATGSARRVVTERGLASLLAGDDFEVAFAADLAEWDRLEAADGLEADSAQQRLDKLRLDNAERRMRLRARIDRQQRA